MDVIIFSGQSNMQGQSECLSECNIVKNAYEYRYLTDEAVPLKNPVGESITYEWKRGYDPTPETEPHGWLATHVTGSACYGHTNLVPAFCRTWTELTGRETLAVHVAKGSTVIANWLPGSPGYEIIRQKSRRAIQKVHSDRIVFVWLQGESDALAGTTKEAYKNSLRTLCDALKRDVGIDLFGIIRVGRFANDDRDLEILAAQDEVCREYEDFAMLTDIATTLNTQSEYMHPRIKGHYSAKGLEALGEAAARGLYKQFS